MKKILLICLVAVNAVLCENEAKQVSAPLATGKLACEHRDYGNGGTVCVCSSSQCDQFESLDRPPLGTATVYTTTKAGERFATKRMKFAETKDNDTVIDFFIHRQRQYQKILGFGGAFTDSAGINIAKLTADMQDRLIRDYFGSNGLRYSMGRIPIGGSDFSVRAYTYDDSKEEDETLSKFALQKEDKVYKIPFLKRAIEASEGGLKLLASPWSAPAWMKTNGEINHGGFIKGKPGGKYYKIYTKYLIKFLEEYAKHNLTMWGLTVENEPGAGYAPKYRWNSLGFDGALERDFVKMDLGPELHSHGYENLKLMIFDDQLRHIKNFTDIVLSDPDAEKYVSGVAFHWYDTPVGGRAALDEIVKKHPSKFVLATEACEEWKGQKHHVSLGNWKAFNRYASDIIKDLQHFSSGWIDWNLAVDLIGGPNWVGNFVDAPIIINETSNEYYKQPMYYALAHFTRFLPPNSVRNFHWTRDFINDEDIDSVAFRRPDNGTVVIMLNKSPDTPKHLLISDVVNGYLNLTLPVESLVTVLWYDD